ncbi:UNVERIFIED_CONTAM: hypothetical protein Sradi_4534400 [Sesamum radiatum]|uniref:Uncharacterized protein n=1 Tax=Sesamum radiatum TaxID=300843 RepID=A0AAW2NCP8_SESRA
MTVNVAPFKLKNTTKNSGAPKNNVPYERPQRKLTLKEMQVREYPFLDSDVSGIFDDLLEAKLIDLLEMKQPEEAKQKDDPRYCKYHHLIGHAIQDCFVFKDKVMQLARQGKISLEEDSTATNAITTDSGHVDDNKDFHINLKQLSKPPLKGFVHSTQEDEGIHEALTIDKKGFDPKAFKLLIQAGYNPKESPALENFLLKPPAKNSANSTLPK